MSILANNIRRAYFAKKGAEPIDPDLLYWLPLDGREMYFAEGYDLRLSGGLEQPFTVSTHLDKGCLMLDHTGSSTPTILIRKDGSDSPTTSSTYTQTCFVAISAKTNSWLGCWNSTGAKSFYVSSQDTINYLTCQFNTGGKRTFSFPFDGAWRHIALQRNGTTGKLFINGSLVGSYTGTFTTSQVGTIAIAPVSSSATEYNYFRDLRYYNRALTDAEILALSQEN